MPSYAKSCKTGTQTCTQVMPSAPGSTCTFTLGIPVGMGPQVFPPTTNPIFGGMTPFTPHTCQCQMIPTVKPSFPTPPLHCRLLHHNSPGEY
ncbi:hypothetical protein O181_044151 [Austropuccinia psidii MF-1]|uniref:Uncharacterized protein n=1 Tax=Austropuccinia psidii MF-1 TaxID=1389203 RepID=A0A9Q3DHY9_9BASI|nr:hypothetical protein [Austropuccinia psidii MF-1]